MYIIYEAATCILVALIAAALPFTVFAISLLLKSGAEYLAGMLCRFPHRALSGVTSDSSRRIVGESPMQEQSPLVEAAVGRNGGNIRTMLSGES